MASVGGGFGRLLGLGFVFGARDTGASRAAGNIAEGMDRVATSVEEAGRASSSLQRLGNAIGAISLAQLDRIGDSLEGLADRAGIDPSDTSLESFGVEFSNTFRRATVGLGPFREEVEGMRGEISSLAYSLDVDANEMISAVTGIARSGNSLDDFGISLRTVAGSIQANILSGEQLANLLTGLSEGYELGTEGATRLVDRVTAVGEAFGFGADAVRRLPEIISAADPVLARFSGLSIEQVTDSVTRLSVAMSRGLGVSFEEGSQAAIELFNSLSEARAGLTDIVTGVGSDFPELATELGIATGDIDEAMQSILSDPLTFATRMRDLMGSMDRSSPAFARLQGALANLPANFRFLITGGEEAGAALEAATQPVGEFEGAFNRMARSGAGTARTFSESMDRLRDGFETRLHRMTSITTREVLGRQRQAYERLGGYLERWSSSGGALGFLTQGFLNVRRYGLVHGLLPMLEHRLQDAFPNLAERISTFAPLLSDLGEGFLQVATSAGPMLVVLSQMGVLSGLRTAFSSATGAVTAFLGPWGIAIAAVAAGAGLIAYYWEDISNVFESIDWAGVAHDAAQAFMGALEWLADGASSIGDWIRSVDWVGVGQTIGDGFRQAFEFVANLFTGEFNGDIANFFADAFDMPADEIVPTILGLLGDIFSETLGQIPAIARGILGGLFGEEVVDAVIEGITSLPSRMMDQVNGILGIMLWPFEQVFGSDHISRLFHQGGVMAIFDDFYDFVVATFEAMGDVWDDVIAPMAEIAWDVTIEVGSAFMDLWSETIQPILDLVGEWWTVDFVDGQEGAQEQILSTGDAFRMMWQRYIRPAIYAFVRSQADAITRFRGWIPVFQSVARFAVRSFFAINSAIRNFRTTFEGARDTLAAGWQLIGTRVRRFFTQPILQAGDSFMTIFENIRIAVAGLRLSFLQIIQSLVSGIRTAFNAIPAPLRSAMGLVGDSLDAAVSSINAAVTMEESRITAARTAIEDERRERAAAVAAQDAEVAAAEAALAAVVAENRARAARERSEAAAAMTRELAGIDSFGERLDSTLERAADRLGAIGTDVQDLEGALPDVATTTTETGTTVVTPVAEDDTRPPVVARTVEDTAGAGGAGGGAATGAPRTRARARMEAAAAAEEATGRERARDIAREMVISAFGPEAVRQLGSALARGGGTSRRRIPAGGSGEEVGG
jgi:hypothetical protein